MKKKYLKLAVIILLFIVAISLIVLALTVKPDTGKYFSDDNNGDKWFFLFFAALTLGGNYMIIKDVNLDD